MEKLIAWIDDIHLLTVIIDHIDEKLNFLEGSPIIYWEKEQKYFTALFQKTVDSSTIQLEVTEELPIGEELILLWGEIKIPVYPRGIVRTEWFDEKYAAIDTQLGAICNQAATTFSIWAPTAFSVQLLLDGNDHKLNKLNNGVWSIEVKGDWHGYPYQYKVSINGTSRIINDPYAKSLLANSEKGVVIDFSRTDQMDSDLKRPEMSSLQDAIIYEMHVRDATIEPESGVLNRGKFLGLAEKATTTQNGFTTGLSYVKDLGCTHVQLLPINDFARVDERNPDNQYNWGYDPLYFQAPEGSYSVLPDRPTARINELKALIQAFHQEGISVILDVVFNHVFVREESSFEQVVPGYYFRYHLDGQLSNGTGVGNDIASERKMARKFILDTIDLMLEEYHVDGFRFDLMGAIDIETMSQIERLCLKQKLPIMLLGEGWELSTALASDRKATSRNANHLPGIRFFNDYFRDTLKGNLFEQTDTGFSNGEGRYLERMPALVSGSVLEEYGACFVSDVNQTVNYVECHDNHTLWDRLQLTNQHTSESGRKKMHQLATGITLLSQGVPFIHAGQEWFRSKQGVENSYISNDAINKLDWKRREQEQENIVFIKSLISLRKKYDVFRMTSKEEIRRRFHVIEAPHPVFGFTLLGDKDDFSIYMNPTNQRFDIHLPSSGKWQRAVTNSIIQDREEIIGEYTEIYAYEFVVLQKTRKPQVTETVVADAGNAYNR